MNCILKTSACTLIAAAGFLALDEPAKAISVICNGFIDTCAPANWTISEPGNGSVTITPTEAVLTSNDDGGGNTSVTMELLAPVLGFVSFKYAYQTLDVDGSEFDPFGYTLDGVFNQIVPPPFLAQGGTTTGSFSFEVSAGQTFGFYAQATDSQLGPSITNISDFVYEVPGPLPILGLAATFGYSRKIRKRINNSNQSHISI